ncbi:MAG: glycosidase [Candidatus Omnitrophota bacterium]
MILKRYKKNPILSPRKENLWESVMTYNCGAVYEEGKVHIVYRAQGSKHGLSRVGYANSKNGFDIDERLDKPIFVSDPASDLECFGIEDPRLTRIGDRIYMNYTAYGKNMGMVEPRKRYQIGIVSISVSDFLNKKWNWSKRIYPFYMSEDKNSSFFPEKINGKYVLIHRNSPNISISYSDDIEKWNEQKILMRAENCWEDFKIGGGAPPIKTDKGWIFIYHGVDNKRKYRLGLALLDIKDPSNVIKRSSRPLLEPETDYERNGIVPDVVFSCGAVLIDDTVFVYYCGADTVICVATAKLNEIFRFLET